jgi:hypothetical protein
MSELFRSLQDLRPIGVIAASAIILYTISKYRIGRYRRLDLIIGLLIGAGVLTVSVYPPIGNYLLGVFQVRNRLFAILILSNFLLYALFFRVLNGVNHNRRTTGELIRALAQWRYAGQPADDATEREIAIVIPAYDEEESIGDVLVALPDQLLGYSVRPLIVVDGSDDRTTEVVRQSGHNVALHVLNRGQGDALRTGFDIALSEGADVVVTMDADGQHRPDELEQLVKPVIDNEADYVMGSRMLGDYEDRGGSRHIGIVCFSWLISLLIGQRITDCTNGYRAIRGSDLAKLQLEESRFNAPELLIEAARNKLRIREVPTTIVSRAFGESKKGPSVEYVLGFAKPAFDIEQMFDSSVL